MEFGKEIILGKKLIITEKPSVARDFARVLKVSGNHTGFIENNEYVISWCYGHLVEMVYPEEYDIKYKSWRLEDLPFLPVNYKYGVVKSAKDQYEVVNKLLHREDIDIVLWAGDSGKEGQTIEENIRNYGGVRQGMEERRVWIDSQTDEEILKGISNAKPMSDYALLGKSGIMRTIEDYSLGINFSRALSVKYGKMINDAAATKSYTAIAIGRVMTCVLGMVVNREREIRNFTETPFYRVIGNFSNTKFNAEYKSVEGSKYFESPLLYKENGFKKIDDANELISSLENKTAVIDSLEISTSKKKAPLLFNLAELQSECSKIFKISPQQTLSVIQDLYERKFTTYPRTDARVLTTAVAKEIKKNINGLNNFEPVSKFVTEIIESNKYIGLEKTSYTDDSKVTDHYAIIPTGQVNGIDKMDSLHRSVYELIVRRFLSIFYPPAEYKIAKIKIDVDKEKFFSNTKVLINPGYMDVTGVKKEKEKDSKDDDDDNDDLTVSKDKFIEFLSGLKKGDSIEVNGYSIKEGKTSPPKRYTSGNLILAMENAGNLIEDEELRQQIKNTGIGTSATRGEILDKLVRIKYLNQNTKTQIITPENLGEMIYEVVKLSVPSLLNPEMTASWEKGLEGIVNGSVDDVEYRNKLEDYIRRETNKMIDNDLSIDIARNIHEFTGKDSKGRATRKPLNIKCPDCGGELSTTSFGYGCSNYYNEEVKCGFSVGAIAGLDILEEDFIDLITNGKTKVISGFKSKNKSDFSAKLVLSKNEEGKSIISFDFEGISPEILENVKCPDCGGNIQMKGSGFGCANFNPDDENSCKFYIGKIASKQLTKENVIELLTENKTKTIRGFKSKNGKKFDACLVLTKNEDGKSSIAFDFENVEVKLLKDAKCPVCGADVQKTSFGYGCTNYSKDKEDSCNFSIGKLCGVKLNDTQTRELLSNGITGVISGFKSKSGKTFDAKIALDYDDDKKVKGLKFVFDDETKVIEEVKCPKCGGSIVKGYMGYRCSNYTKEEGGCDFFVGKIAGVIIEEEQFIKLINNKSTDKINGFISKKGSNFDAILKLSEDNKITFDFS